MSKFFAEGNISDEDNSAGSEQNQNPNRNGPSYQYDFMDDDRGNNEKRVVRTEKEKKWNLIKEITVKINNALNIQDFERVWTLLQDILKEVEKIAKLIEKEGYPQHFLRCLKKVKDEIAEVDGNAEAKKKMKKHSATAFNTMKQKFKKIYPDFEAAIEADLAKGQEQSEESQEEAEQDDDEDSSEDEEDDKTLLSSPDPMVRRKYWLKRPKRKETNEQQDEKGEEERKKIKEDKQKEQDKKKHEKKEKKAVVATKKKTVVEIQSIKDAENRMKEIRKNFMRLHNQEERQDYLLTLDKISEKTVGYKDFEKLSFYLLDIPIRIDVCRQMKLTHFPRNQWSKLCNTIIKINHILRESEEDDLLSNIRLFEDTSSRTEAAAANVTEQGIYLSLKTYLVLIESELKKALTYLDSNEPEYCERLQDLIGLVNLMYKISKQIQSFDDVERDAAELAFKVLENTYFLSAALIDRIHQEVPEKHDFFELVDQQQLEAYGNLILRHSKDEETRIKTLLYLIYNHAVNYREKGKELLVVSTLSEVILHQDYYTQALYNRALVQLGLCAFRSGNMFEVQQFLYEMCSGARMRESTKDVLKEYLAQGYSRLLGEKDIPKSKILPAYLHLNVDLVESVELVAGMLLELPYTLTEGGRITSKTFKKFYYEYERNYFIEESLNNRDLIYAAGLHLREGKWAESFDKLSHLSFWSTLPGADTARSNLLRVVKQQSLKCYLIANRKCFRSISIGGLAAKFELEERSIRKLICKLISERILQGAITREGYLIFAQKKQSEVQKICETLANRLQEMGQANEQWFSQKVNAGVDSEQEGEKEEKPFARKLNLAINQKLKSILSKRIEKY